MTPPNEPPSNPYDPSWPKPEHPAPTQPFGQDAGETAPYAPYGEPQPYAQDQPPYGQPTQAPYGQAPYGQAPYGQAPYGQVPYGQAPYGAPVYGGAMMTPHPSATTAMVLGIGALGGMFVCGIPIVLAPFAWMVGGRAVKEIDANPGRYSGREQAQAGRIMGMIGTALLVLGIVSIIAIIALAISTDTSTSPDPVDYSYDSEL